MKRKTVWLAVLLLLVLGMTALADSVPTAAVSSFPAPLYVKPGSKSAGVSMAQGQLCLKLDEESLAGKTWVHLVCLDQKGQYVTGYAEGECIRQLQLSELITALDDPVSKDVLKKLSGYEVSGKETEIIRSTAVQEEPATDVHQYVLNKNTKKFHETWCDSVDDIKPKNRKDFSGTREEVIRMGYKPCKKCGP